MAATRQQALPRSCLAILNLLPPDPMEPLSRHGPVLLFCKFHEPPWVLLEMLHKGHGTFRQNGILWDGPWPLKYPPNPYNQWLLDNAWAAFKARWRATSPTALLVLGKDVDNKDGVSELMQYYWQHKLCYNEQWWHGWQKYRALHAMEERQQEMQAAAAQEGTVQRAGSQLGTLPEETAQGGTAQGEMTDGEADKERADVGVEREAPDSTNMNPLRRIWDRDLVICELAAIRASMA
jgi:hypothetical protein